MNDWGIPNWRYKAAYGETKGWTENRWRWEFLRRREDLRLEFDRKSEDRHATSMALFDKRPEAFPLGRPLSPLEPGFTVSTRLIGDVLQGLPNPRIGDQPPKAISWYDRPDAWVQFMAEQPPEGWIRCDFDLSKPIEPQLEAARKALREHQRDTLGKLVIHRKRPDKRLTYLRVLDARASGASWSELAEILDTTDKSISAARASYRAALALSN